MMRFGNIIPILIDQNDVIIAGEQRWRAAQLAGFVSVPVIRISHLNAAEKRAYRIADNRLAEKGSDWSLNLLKLEVDLILELDASFDLELTGFDQRDLDLRFDAERGDPDPSDEQLPVVVGTAVARPGDLWQLGAHRLLCGDATASNSYQMLMADELATMMFTDPPYNVKMKGHATGNGRIKHREFVQASGEMSDAVFQQFLLAFMLCASRAVRRGGLHYICMDWRRLRQLLLAGEAAYDEQVNLCVWTKTNAGLGSFYRSQHELIGVFRKGGGAKVNNVEFGVHGRNRSNVWPNVVVRETSNSWFLFSSSSISRAMSNTPSSPLSSTTTWNSWSTGASSAVIVRTPTDRRTRRQAKSRTSLWTRVAVAGRFLRTSCRDRYVSSSASLRSNSTSSAVSIRDFRTYSSPSETDRLKRVSTSRSR